MTLFERIIAREIPAEIVWEDADCIAIRDIAPQAPVHVLVIPKKRIVRIGEAEPTDADLLGKLLLTAAHVARLEGLQGLEGSGFRVVINNGSDGGETVPHLHLHVLGGRALGWPPG